MNKINQSLVLSCSSAFMKTEYKLTSREKEDRQIKLSWPWQSSAQASWLIVAQFWIFSWKWHYIRAVFLFYLFQHQERNFGRQFLEETKVYICKMLQVWHKSSKNTRKTSQPSPSTFYFPRNSSGTDIFILQLYIYCTHTLLLKRKSKHSF